VAHAALSQLACPLAATAADPPRTGPIRDHDAASSTDPSPLDDPAFLKNHATEDEAGVTRIELAIRGMHCAACVWRVEALPERLGGVYESRVNFRRGRLRLAFDRTRVSLGDVANHLARMGYEVGPVSASATAARLAEDHAAMIRMAVAGACAGNAMLLAFALYAGLFDGMQPLYREAFRWGSLLVTGVALLWPGMVFFRTAWAGLRTGSVNLDAPIALALMAGGVWSAFSTIKGRGEVYFDSVSVLIFALLVGRFIQQRQQRWAADSVELLFSLTPRTARRVVGAGGDERVERVSASAIEPGDLVEVGPGESFPVDGTIVVGRTAVDTSLLTGESLPRTCAAGDPVYAGAVNVSATVRCRVTASGSATRVAKLMALVEEASGRKAPIVRFADKVGGIFLTGMMLLAVATFVIWIGHGVHVAMEHAVSLLVVTCPCALGLATPLAFTLAIGRAAGLNILIKGGDVVQHLAAGGTIYLDKTGTLTHGRMSLVHWRGPDTLLALVAAAERDASHPVGRALASCASGLPPARSLDSVTTLPGEGLVAVTGASRVAVGSLRLARRMARTMDAELLAAAAEWAGEGLTPVYVVLDGELCGVAAVGDQVRVEAPSVILALERRGWACRILSGDDERAVAHVAKACGVAWSRGGASPEEKMAIVKEAASRGNTVMVGDGVNDAGALAAAHVGVSVHGGAEASLAAADVYLATPGLSPLFTLVDGCGRTLRVIRWTLAASSAYNVAAAAVAMSGHMHPIMAALVMPLSSLTAVSICVGSRFFRSGP
jgi:Cu2+-exporting ATPase